MPVLIHNAAILQPDSHLILGDIYLENGIIQAIAAELNANQLSVSGQTIKEIDA